MIGHLTRDIELRYLPSGDAIGKSAIATSYKYKTQSGEQKEEVCFLDFDVFGRSAEILNQYVKKGSKVMVEGRLIINRWTAQDGTNRSNHTLRVENFKFLDSKEQTQQQAPQQAPQQQYQAPTQQAPQQQYQAPATVTIDDDDIPF